MVKRILLHKVSAQYLGRGWLFLLLVCGLSVALTTVSAELKAQTLRESLKQRRQQHQLQSAQFKQLAPREYAYGTQDKQTLDIYPAQVRGAQLAPVIVMVHGGAWRTGDKRNSGVVENKWQHWGAQGAMVVSLNYRLLPEAKPDQQVSDVALAMAWLQRELPALGGDPQRIILMGHSAGAHLISLLSVSTSLQQQFALHPWRLSIALDSAVYDVPNLMQARHLPLYDAAFGKDSRYWLQMSPLVQMQQATFPFISVCSSQRRDGACQQAQGFVDKARSLGSAAELVAVDLSHGEINHLLGSAGAYTNTVDALIAKLIGSL